MAVSRERRRCLCGLHGILLTCALAACQTAARNPAPAPESEQVISDHLKDLYMAASAAPPHSAEQQRLILKMADRAANGKELMLVMRAAIGVFPQEGRPAESSTAAQVRAKVTAKMMQAATLDQLSDFASQYTVDSANARAYVERMFQLGTESRDARAWSRIRLVASHLRVNDLEQRAQTRVDELAGR